MSTNSNRRQMSNSRKQIRKKNYISRTKKLALPVGIYAVLFLFCTIVGVLNTMPQSYIYEVGGVAEENVTANKDVVDQYSTNLLKQEAMQKVLPVYVIDETSIARTEEQIISDFTSLDQVRKIAQTTFIENHPEMETVDFSLANWENELSGVMTSLKDLVPPFITEQNICTVAPLGSKELGSLKDALVEATRDALKNGIQIDELSETVEEIRSIFVDDERFTVEEAALAHNYVLNILDANETYDQETTELKKQEASDAVADITYKKGQIIVRQGDIITEAQYQLILQLGYVNVGNHEVTRWIVGSLLMLSIFVVGGFHIFYNDRELITDMKLITQACILVVFTVIIGLICRRIDLRLCPVFIIAIIASVSFKKDSALYIAVFSSALYAFMMSPEDTLFFDDRVLRILISGIMGSVVAVLFMRGNMNRSRYIIAGVITGGIASLVYIAYAVLNSFTFVQYVSNVGFALISGLISGVLALGVMPLWENTFRLSTPSKLLELTDPSRPLLRRLMVEAPGTYHHSLMVANLAEAGAEAVGADALLTRVAAYYHDTGKLYNPLMFTENQVNIRNPHETMTPKESAAVIRRHVLDGVRLCQNYGLPDQVVRIISQHHGDSTVSFFFFKAKQEDENADIKDYSYPCEKPQTREAGILMLADITEAAIRSKKAASDPDLKDVITQLVKSKYDDGQFDNCPLTRKDIIRVINAFYSIYEGSRHERVQYPSDMNKDQNRQNEAPASQAPAEETKKPDSKNLIIK